MALILQIDTATELASICISRDGKLLDMQSSQDQKNHAGFLQPAIKDILAKSGWQLADFDAVAVTIGPGSYTGLRVGLASAKGICFALNKPLITLNTLQVMASAAQKAWLAAGMKFHPETYFCPLIDARRMEVFTAFYDEALKCQQEAHALVVDSQSFNEIYPVHPLVCSGSGAKKLAALINDPRVSFMDCQHDAADMINLAETAHASGLYADLAYCEPLYVKAFFDTAVLKK